PSRVIFFFYQAEDGIRDRNVTGVQTCALPIWGERVRVQRIEVENKPYPLYLLLDKEYQLIEPVMKFIKYLDNTGKSPNTIKAYRSEERRVGKECRNELATDHYTENKPTGGQ